jgi:hypothetical protein
MVGGMPELIDNQFLFSKGNVGELSIIIKNMINNNTQLLDQSKRNFERSKSYETDRLNLKRGRFYHDFLKNHDFQI